MTLPTGISVTGARIIDGDSHELDINSDGSINVAGQLVPEVYDYISLSYSGDNVVQAIYKTGGASGTKVAQLDVTYSGDSILTVTKT